METRWKRKDFVHTRGHGSRAGGELRVQIGREPGIAVARAGRYCLSKHFAAVGRDEDCILRIRTMMEYSLWYRLERRRMMGIQGVGIAHR